MARAFLLELKVFFNWRCKEHTSSTQNTYCPYNKKTCKNRSPSDWFKNCLLPVSVRSPLAMGGQFQPFYWPTSVISGVMVCAPSCPNWRTSPESTDSSAGTKPLPRQDVIAFCLCVFFMGHKYCFSSHPHSSVFSLPANFTVCVDARPLSRLPSHTLLFWYSIAPFFFNFKNRDLPHHTTFKRCRFGSLLPAERQNDHANTIPVSPFYTERWSGIMAKKKFLLWTGCVKGACVNSSLGLSVYLSPLSCTID